MTEAAAWAGHPLAIVVLVALVGVLAWIVLSARTRWLAARADELEREVRDRTERLRRAEERLRERRWLEAMGLLAGGLAHHLNNRLAGILGSVDLIRSRSERADLEIDRIESDARRASDLVHQLLASSGRGRWAVEPLDLSALVRHALRRPPVPLPNGARLSLEVSESLPEIEADRDHLVEAVENVVTNAIEAIGPGGTVVVRTLPVEDVAWPPGEDGDIAPGPRVVLEVEDDGCGMDEDTLRRLFDPFFSTKEVGRGMGLAAVLGVIRAHGGTVHVDSRPNEGTRVRVLLPVVGIRREVRTPAPSDRRAVSEREHTVLVVDDDPSVLEVARGMVETLGMRAVTAVDGEQALAVLEELDGSVDCLLLDISMPGMDGHETLAAARQRWPGLNAVMMSGYSTLRDDDVAEAEVSAFLGKPFRIRQLRDALAAVVGDLPDPLGDG